MRSIADAAEIFVFVRKRWVFGLPNFFSLCVCTMKDMENLSQHPALKGIYMDQVQDFTPTPMTTSSVMYYTGLDPRDMKPVFVERDPEKKRRQKSFFFKTR